MTVNVHECVHVFPICIQVCMLSVVIKLIDIIDIVHVSILVIALIIKIYFYIQNL